MFYAKMAQKSIVFALLVVFITSQVSAKKCYLCYSEYDGECETNPRQEKFEFNCGPPNTMMFSTLWSDSNQSTDDFIVSDESQPIINECVAATYTNLKNGKQSVARACVPTLYRDRTLEYLSLFRMKIQTDEIHRCNSELCNGY